MHSTRDRDMARIAELSAEIRRIRNDPALWNETEGPILTARIAELKAEKLELESKYRNTDRVRHWMCAAE